MKYPKQKRRKKRKEHKPSILHQKDGTCYLCIKLRKDYRIHPVVHEHHIFGGPNRQISEAEGLKVYLCLEHHLWGRQAVHNNHEIMRLLQQDGQRAYERTHSREEFMTLIGRNYLDMEPFIVSPEEEEKVEPGITFLEADCNGCFGAAENQCKRCEEERCEKNRRL